MKKTTNKTKTNRATISEDRVRKAIRKIVSEEYAKLTEAPVDNPGTAASSTSGDNIINKLMDKIPNLPAVQQLIRRVPQRSPKAAAEIIMSIIDAMETKTTEPKARLISRELIYMLRDKIQGKSA